MRELAIWCVCLVWCSQNLAAFAQANQPPTGGNSGGATGNVSDQPEGEDPVLPPVDVIGEQPTITRPVVTQPVVNNASLPANTQVTSWLTDTFGESGPFSAHTGVLRNPTSLFNSSAAASIRGREEIERRGAIDMFQALENEVGVLMQRTAAGQASPFVRGLTGQQVLILVDGIRLNNSIFRFGPNQYFNTIDPGSVEQIEVLRGRGSVLWGADAIGGAINVTTRSANAQRGIYQEDYLQTEVNTFYNTANSSPYVRTNVDGWFGNIGVYAGASYANVRDLDTGWDQFGRQPGTNYQQHGGDIKLNMLLTENQMLTFAFQHFQLDDVPRSDRFPGFPFDLNSSNSNGGARFFDPQQRDLAYIRYQAIRPNELVDALTFTASYHRQRDNQTRGMPTTTRFQETDVETVGANIVASKDLGDFGKVTTGADWYHDDVDSTFGGSASGPIIPDDAYYERLGAFFHWEVLLAEGLTTNAGIRYELADLAATPTVGGTPVGITPGFHDWVGQAGFVYEVNSNVNLVGSISEGFRAPNLDELTANNPNVLQQGMDLPSLGLAPEHSINYEVGVKTNFENVRMQTFVYWIDLDNNIVPISAGSNQFRRANQDSFIQGVEFNGDVQLTETWSLYSNFWYTYGVNDVTNAPLSRIPPTQGMLGLRATTELGYLDFFSWMSRRQDRLDPVRDISDERIPPGGTPGFATLNLRMGRWLTSERQHRVSLSLENLLDKNYLVHGSGVLGTGFTARFGYTYRR